MSNATLQALTSALFDHAGQFPPTARELDDAFLVAASFPERMRRPEMIASDMVLKFDQLHAKSNSELERIGFKAPQGYRASVLASKSLSSLAELHLFKSEIAEILEYNQHGAAAAIPAQVISYDITLDHSFHCDQLKLGIALAEIAEKVKDKNLLVFFEPDLSGDNWHAELSLMTECLEQANQQSRSAVFLGLKIRGAGPKGINPERMSYVLPLAAQMKLGLKATGGFHFSVANRGNFAGAPNQHGFLNLVAAVVLSRSSNLGQLEIQNILENTNPDFYQLEGQSLMVGTLSVSSREVQKARDELAFSIGCCNPLIADQDLWDIFPEE